jgi:hypothetical protein
LIRWLKNTTELHLQQSTINRENKIDKMAATTEEMKHSQKMLSLVADAASSSMPMFWRADWRRRQLANSHSTCRGKETADKNWNQQEPMGLEEQAHEGMATKTSGAKNGADSEQKKKFHAGSTRAAELGGWITGGKKQIRKCEWIKKGTLDSSGEASAQNPFSPGVSRNWCEDETASALKTKSGCTQTTLENKIQLCKTNHWA